MAAGGAAMDMDKSTLETTRLILRPPVDGDGEAIYRSSAIDAEVARLVMWRAPLLKPRSAACRWRR
jgi:hypothetical protein